MAATSLAYRWTQQAFLRATEAGVFDGRVELVDGQVRPVSIGRWHGRAVARCVVALATAGVDVTTESLATGGSLPDPDVWVCPEAATETGWLCPRISTWSPSDVLLVVEVSDETVAEDLGVKARLYGAAGCAVYWVLTRDTLYEHTCPTSDGYRSVVRHRRGDEVTLPYAAAAVSVADLLGE